VDRRTVDDPPDVLVVFQNFDLVSQKKKLEADVFHLTGEADDFMEESRSAEEKAKKAITDVSPDLQTLT